MLYVCYVNPGKVAFNDLLSTALEVDVSWIELPSSRARVLLSPLSIPLSLQQAHARVFGLLLQAHPHVFGSLLQARAHVLGLLFQILS